MIVCCSSCVGRSRGGSTVLGLPTFGYLTILISFSSHFWLVVWSESLFIAVVLPLSVSLLT